MLANDNAAPATSAEFAGFCLALAGQAPAALVARGEITLCGKAYAYELLGPGYYRLTRGSGQKREQYLAVPAPGGGVWIARGAGSLATLTLKVDAAGRLAVSK